MDIYKPINKHFFENKKIKISFSKVLNKKERYFLKFLFTEYKLLEKLEKTTVLSDIELAEIMKVLKFKSFQQLKKFPLLETGYNILKTLRNTDIPLFL